MPKPEPAAKKVETKEQEVPVLKKEEEPETEENHTGRSSKCVKRECRVLRLQRHLG